MTKKDYVLLVNVFNESNLHRGDLLEFVKYILIPELQKDNPNFNSSKFMEGLGYE